MASIDTNANSMATITADGALQSLLAPLTSVTEIRTADGKLMGRFTPVAAIRGSAEWDELYRRAMALFDPDEIRRRTESEEPCLTTQEVLKYIDSLEPK